MTIATVEMLWIIVAQIVVFSLFPFYFATLDRSLRAIAFYVYIAVILVLGGFLGSVYALPLTESIIISGGSLAYGALMMSTVLLVIVEGNLAAVRNVIRLVVTVNVLVFLLFNLFSWTLRQADIVNPFNTSPDLFSTSLFFMVLGMVLILGELLLMLALFEGIKRRVSNPWAITLLYTACFILALALDGVFFPLLAFPMNPALVQIIAGGMPGKLIMATGYSLSILLFLGIFRGNVTTFAETPLKLRDLLRFTSREQLIQEIEQQEQQLRQLSLAVDQSPNGVAITDLDGHILYTNRSYEQISGLSSEALNGRIPDFFQPDKVGFEQIQTMWALLNQGQIFQQEMEAIRPDGMAIWQKIIVAPILDNNGTVDNLLIIGEDISQMVQHEAEKSNLEAQLRHAQRMETIGTLAGGIAHDFNNILTPILGYAQLTEMKLGPDAPLRPYVQKITAAANRAKDLVSQILTFSRQIEQQRSIVEIQPMIEEAEHLLRPALPSSIEILRDVDPLCPPILAVPSQINQILINLGTNAFHAMEEKGGALTLSLREATLEEVDLLEEPTSRLRRFARISVQDQGVGMNKETLNRVFDPFFSTKPVGKGTGLGLAVVHGIVTAHGGEIQIDSQPSIGTTVTVFLPLAEAYSQSVNLEQSNGEIVRGSERILVLDDEPTIVAVIQQALTGWGFEVEGYTDPVVALEIMREAPEKFDLIVTDLTMPHLTGLEFVHALRESIPNLKVIMISGSGVPISKQQLTRLGISTSMAKPLDLVQLGYTIRTLLDG